MVIDRELKVIELGPAEPMLADVAFASVDAGGTRGALNGFVFSALGYEDPPYPSAKQLKRGFTFVRKGDQRPVVLVVTVLTPHSVQLALRDNLTRALKMRRRDLVGRTLWIPLMGTGAGGLTNEESLSSTLEAIQESGIALNQGASKILLATPPG